MLLAFALVPAAIYSCLVSWCYLFCWYRLLLPVPAVTPTACFHPCNVHSLLIAAISLATCSLLFLSAVLICSQCLHLYPFLLLFPILALVAYYCFYLQTTLTPSVYSVAACNRACFRHQFRWPALKLTSSAIYTSLRKRTLTQKLLRRINFVSEFYQYLRKQHILAWFLSFVFIKKPSMKSTISAAEVRVWFSSKCS